MIIPVEFSPPRPRVAGLWLVLLSLAGCFDPMAPKKGTVLVTGTVTLDGEPLELGLLKVMSEDGKQVVDQCGIADGKYRLYSRQTGTLPVQIYPTGHTIRPAAKVPGKNNLETPELIPKRYNTETELTATIDDSGENVIDFELLSN